MPSKGRKPESLVRDLGREFRALAKAEDPQRRGYEFEELLGELLRRNGFTVRRSPGSTRPRQTDLLAMAPDLTLVCSAKWEREPVGAPAVDDLRIRLEKVPRGAVGCLFSASGFAEGAADYAADYRASFELLLFSAAETTMVLSGGYSVQDLIVEKRQALRETGRMLFVSREQGSRAEPPGVNLPDASMGIRVGTRTVNVVAVPSSQMRSFVYAYRMREAASARWGRGVRLSLSLPFGDLGKLARFLHTLPAAIGLSENGTFAIHQSRTTWHGYGINTLLRECQGWRRRYASHPGKYHHSELCVYYSETRHGWVVVTFQLSANDSRRISYGDMEIRLPGMPVDLAPYQVLCKGLGNEGFLEAVSDEREVEWVRFRNGPRLDVVNLITERRGGWVGALVAKNPYFGGKLTIPRMGLFGASLDFLSGEEMIVCTVSDMHPRDSRIDYYYLTEIAAIPAAIRQPVEISCTWNSSLDVPTPPRTPATPEQIAKVLSYPARKATSRRSTRRR